MKIAVLEYSLPTVVFIDAPDDADPQDFLTKLGCFRDYDIEWLAADKIDVQFMNAKGELEKMIQI